MRIFFGMILGALLLTGGVYVHDSMQTTDRQVAAENRNIVNLKQAFEEELGFAAPQPYRQQVAGLARLYREGRTEDIKSHYLSENEPRARSTRLFQNVDGIKFLLHEGAVNCNRGPLRCVGRPGDAGENFAHRRKVYRCYCGSAVWHAREASDALRRRPLVQAINERSARSRWRWLHRRRCKARQHRASGPAPRGRAARSR